MSHPILGSFITAAALLLLGSAYLLSGSAASGSAMLAAVAVGLLLSVARLLGRRHIG